MIYSGHYTEKGGRRRGNRGNNIRGGRPKNGKRQSRAKLDIRWEVRGRGCWRICS